MNSVIVTDVRYRMSLPVIRSLGKDGFHIIATEQSTCKKGAELGFYSKYTSKTACISGAEENPAQFVADLKKLSESCTQRPVIIPVGITSILAMCERHNEVEKFADAALPPLSSIELANDKSRLIPFARSLGVPVPETTFLKENETVEELSLRISYPAVIKFPAGEMLGLSPDERYKIVNTKQEFLKSYPEFAKYGGDILVQQYITGDGYGVSAVFGKNHEPLEIFCHHRLREYPASGGPSCFCESADLPELVDHAIKLLRALNWVGVAMVEFKGSRETGVYLMEINPRFWGSSALAPNSGCNISLALFRAARGEEASEFTRFTPRYKVGHKMRFLLQDLLAFSTYFRRSKSKIKFTISFISGLLNPRISDGVLDIRDIRSSARYLKCALKKTDSIVR